MAVTTWTPPLHVERIAADVCRRILAERPDQPLAIRLPDHIWPQVHERTSACPEIPSDTGKPDGPLLELVPSGYAVAVNVYVGTEWTYDFPDWLVRYPDGFGPYRAYANGTELGEQFRADLTALVERRLRQIAAGTGEIKNGARA